MPGPPSPDISAILRELGADVSPTPETNGRLFQAVYGELRAIAGRLMSEERPDHTLQPTELVHEAYLRLVDDTRVDWRGRNHFLAIAARAMRQVLVDHARARNSGKRGGRWSRVTLEECVIPGRPTRDADVDVLRLHDALDRLAVMDARSAHVCELRIFGGLTMEEIAAILGASRRTVNYDWSTAKPWLVREVLSEA